MTTLGRCEELLAERATQGLAGAETQELDRLLRRNPKVDPEGFDRAAAAIHLAMVPRVEPLPAALRQTLLEQWRSESWSAPTAGTTAAPSPVLEFEPPAPKPAPPAARSPVLPWLAAAVALALALIGWWPRLQPGEVSLAVDETPVGEVEGIETASDALRLPLSATEDQAALGAGGVVVWNPAKQQGFMRIRGLEANDPSQAQYQLWIFDRERDERYPVDGGVFDMPAAGEAVIPIDAKIAVGEPYLFAVTVEKPGGVVVSSRERIVLLAQV